MQLFAQTYLKLFCDQPSPSHARPHARPHASHVCAHVHACARMHARTRARVSRRGGNRVGTLEPRTRKRPRRRQKNLLFQPRSDKISQKKGKSGKNPEVFRNILVFARVRPGRRAKNRIFWQKIASSGWLSG